MDDHRTMSEYAMRQGGKVPIPAVSLLVRWDWEYDTDRYWLAHETFNPVTGERYERQSHCFKWKPVDAVGDCSLAVRWVRAARTLLSPADGGVRRVG